MLRKIRDLIVIKSLVAIWSSPLMIMLIIVLVRAETRIIEAVILFTIVIRARIHQQWLSLSDKKFSLSIPHLHDQFLSFMPRVVVLFFLLLYF